MLALFGFVLAVYGAQRAGRHLAIYRRTATNTKITRSNANDTH
jgi:hypothetical protein